MLSGCLIDDPPAYTQPRQTPPRLNAHDAQPSPNEFIVAKTNDLLTFNIGVSSEDAGEGLTAQLLLDYTGGDNPDLVRYQNLPPSTIDDPSKRVFELSWKIRRGLLPGCHLFTLRAAHSGNLFDVSKPPTNTADLAEVYWFANVDIDTVSEDMLVPCPGLQ